MISPAGGLANTVTRTVVDYRRSTGHRPDVLRMGKLTIRQLALDAGLPEITADRAALHWEGSTVVGIPIILDPALRPGVIGTEL